MPAKWLMYIPRARDLAETKDVGNKPSLVTRANGWCDHVQGKVAGTERKYDFYVRCYGEKLPGTIGQDDVIYVFGGHGIANRDSVGWPGDNGNLISSQEVADSLESEGLTHEFSGRLKVYSCHSSETGKTAFASLFAEKMRAKKFTACSIFGYEGQITQAYEEINLSKITHKAKYRGPEEDAGMHRWSIVQAPFYAGRTSKHRTEY